MSFVQRLDVRFHETFGDVLKSINWWARFERFTYEGRNNGVRPFAEHILSSADRVAVLGVGGDRVVNALWRAKEGRAVEALRDAGRAEQTDIIILIGLNDVTAQGRASDVVGGVCALVSELKAKLCNGVTRVFVLELPLLPMFSPRMRESAETINKWLGNIGATGEFIVPKYTSLMDEHGTVMPRWLISRSDVHLNREGYEVFARFLRSLIIMQGGSKAKLNLFGQHLLQ